MLHPILGIGENIDAPALVSHKPITTKKLYKELADKAKHEFHRMDIYACFSSYGKPSSIYRAFYNIY